jgi:glutaredoxin 3
MAQKVTLYTTPTCTWCARMKEFFKQHNVKYEEVDVKTDLKARESMIKKSGQMGVPVVEIGDTIIVGFNEPALKKVLKL